MLCKFDQTSAKLPVTSPFQLTGSECLFNGKNYASTNSQLGEREHCRPLPYFQNSAHSPVQYNLFLTADVKERKQNILNNKPNPDNSP